MANPRILLQTMIPLASALFGLMAALAWNEAIKTTITRLFGAEGGLAGLYTYAVIATVLAIVVLAVLGRAAARLGDGVGARAVD